MRPIKVIVPPGSIFNPNLPGAANARGITGFRAIETVFGALSRVVPERVSGCERGRLLEHQHRRHVAGRAVRLHRRRVRRLGRTAGPGRRGRDIEPRGEPVQPAGRDGRERQSHREIVEYGFVQDSGGPGKYRGGLASVREWKLVADEAVFTVRSDRRTHLPYGVAGRQAGHAVVEHPQPRRPPADPSGAAAGGHRAQEGGFGAPPCTRPGPDTGIPWSATPRLVLDDVLDEKLGIDYVRSEYGVVVDPDTLALDVEATAGLRRQMSEDRDGSEDPPSHVEHFGAGTRSRSPALAGGLRPPVPTEHRPGVPNAARRAPLAAPRTASAPAVCGRRSDPGE